MKESRRRIQESSRSYILVGDIERSKVSIYLSEEEERDKVGEKLVRTKVKEINFVG